MEHPGISSSLHVKVTLSVSAHIIHETAHYSHKTGANATDVSDCIKAVT